MATRPEPPPKKPKQKRQTPEERREALRYNHMMYGPTAGERRPAAKRMLHGTAYLEHPKFQQLMTAFKQGTAAKFEVTDKGRTFTIATQDAQISFDGKVVFYARPVNRYESNLLLDRAAAVSCQAISAFAHLVFAVFRSLPEIEPPALSYLQNQFYLAGETLDVGIAEQGPNLLLGSFRTATAKPLDRPRT